MNLSEESLSIVYGKTCRMVDVMEQILFVMLGFAPTLAAMQAAWKMANRNAEAA